MPDLHTALEAAITARLWLATTATPGPWVVGGQGRRELRHPNGELFCVGIDDGERARWVADTWDGPDAAHIAVNDPAQIIRDCEYHLKVLNRHAPIERPTGTSCDYCESLCHSRSGLGCESPDAPWPCDDYRDVLDVYPEDA